MLFDLDITDNFEVDQKWRLKKREERGKHFGISTLLTRQLRARLGPLSNLTLPFLCCMLALFLTARTGMAQGRKPDVENAVAASNPIFHFDHNGSTTLPFELVQNSIYVRVRINNKPLLSDSQKRTPPGCFSRLGRVWAVIKTTPYQ